MDRNDEYRNFARYYDFFMDPLFRPVRRRIRRIVLDRAPENVADICCGTGALLRMLRGQGLTLTGLDLSEPMLAQARRKGRGIRWIQADAARLPLPDGGFGCVVISMALHEKEPESRRPVLAEALRILQPDGLLIVMDYLDETRGIGRLAQSLTARVEKSAGDRHVRCYHDFMAGGGIRGLLARCGLRAALDSVYWFGAAGLFLVRPGAAEAQAAVDGKARFG